MALKQQFSRSAVTWQTGGLFKTACGGLPPMDMFVLKQRMPRVGMVGWAVTCVYYTLKQHVIGCLMHVQFAGRIGELSPGM
jgi:hypothetical protein